MQVDKGDKIIRAATVVGTRRIGLSDFGRDQKIVRPDHDDKNTDTTLQDSTNADHLEFSALVQADVSNDDIANGTYRINSSAWQENVLVSLETELESLKRENADLVKQLQEMRDVRSDFEDQIGEKKEQAADQGYSEGYEAGLRKAREQTDMKLAEFESLFEALKAAAEGHWNNVEEFATQIGLSALLKVIADHLGTENFTKGLIVQAVKKVRSEQILKVRLSPEDFELMESSFDGLRQQLSPSGLEFVSDSRVEGGGCILESGRGGWDARLETQLQRLKDSLSPLADRE